MNRLFPKHEVSVTYMKIIYTLDARQHLYLIVLWILFCIHHSFFAGQWWKSRMQKLLGNSFRFYRLYYSIFATVYLIPLLYLQFTIDSMRVWGRHVFSEFTGVLMVIAGLSVMLICIRKYFFHLSGVKALVKDSHSPNQLQTDGLHTIVRHPLYFGTLLFIWGCSFLFPLLSNLIACSLISIYTVAGIQMEERKLIMEFGERYKVYARKVPMLIPRISIRTRRAERRLSELIRSWIY